MYIFARSQFGEVGVDDALVRERFETTEDIFEMNNGCICCTVRGDLIRILSKLFRRGTKLDGVIIETTGLADPGPCVRGIRTRTPSHSLSPAPASTRRLAAAPASAPAR